MEDDMVSGGERFREFWDMNCFCLGSHYMAVAKLDSAATLRRCWLSRASIHIEIGLRE